MNRITVTVYTTGPSCMKCTMTKKHLTRRGIPFTEIPIDDDNREAILALDFSTAPIVCVNIDGIEQPPWDDYRPERIDAIWREAIAS